MGIFAGYFIVKSAIHCYLASMQYALNMPIAIYSLTQGDTWLMGQTSTAEASSMQHAVK